MSTKTTTVDPFKRLQSYAEQQQQIIQEGKHALLDELKTLTEHVKLLGGNDILSEPAFAPYLSQLGLTHSEAEKPEAKVRQSSRLIGEKEILSFIGDGKKSQAEIRDKYPMSYLTLKKKLNLLLNQKKLVSSKNGREVIYSAK